MAAYAALVSLMNLINDIQHHPSPPISLDNQLLDSIAQRITFLHDFLQAYTPSPVDDNDDECSDPLEMRIANAAYAVEDAIESHIVDNIQQQQQGSAITSNEYDAAHGLKNQNDENIRSVNLQVCCDSLQRVIEEMDSIKKVVVEKMVTEDNNNNKKKMTPVIQDLGATNNVLASNQTMVGFHGVSLQIMEKLAGDGPKLQVIPIVGMGGIGKTFLAKSIYTRPFIKEHFDICVWATISQQYNVEEILCEIHSINKERLSGKSEDELGSEIHKYLFGRRFLIVLDDMWSINAWDKIQRFFPNNQNGSRILVTTRLSQLSSQLNNNYSLHMSFLDEASSWDLFSKTVFGDNSSCPRELKEIGEKIVKHCRGLPLSIAVVGGLLKKMDADPTSWESIQDNLSSIVNMENDKRCLRLLKMSYNHLPVYLKPCFLYMGVYKEDDDIRVGALLKLWVSEGFLKPANGETLERTARRFLQDLIDRNLILVHALGSTGSVKSCKIHDLVRDLCLKEGQKDGFYHFIGQGNPPPQRRVVILRNTSKEKVCDVLRSMSHARSVVCEEGTKDLLFEDMRLLRALQDFPHYDERYADFLDEINHLKSLAFGHVNLRHLTINSRQSHLEFMSKFLLPSVVSHIWNLQTLKVDCHTEPNSSFSDFWKMSHFRHFEFRYDCLVHLPEPPSDGRVIMENLHTLKGVLNFKFCEGMIKRIPNIKKLKLYYDDEKDDEYFVENIQSLCRLESLYIESWKGYLHNKLTFSYSLKKLCLYVKGGFQPEDTIEWEDCILERIGSLPFLEKLRLCGGRFKKGEWETTEGQFPSLKYLGLYWCHGLKNWTAAEGSSYILPRLEQLCLYDMYNLETIPCEVGNIDTLRIIELNECEEELVKCAKKMVDEQVESQGEEQVCFHVEVLLWAGQDHLLSLAGPNFKVSLE